MATLLTPDYTQRRERAQRRMDRLARGSRTRCSFAIQLAPSLVSTILTGTYSNVDMLERIEAWLDAQPYPLR